MNTALQIGAIVYVAGWLYFGVVTILTIPADEARRHALAVFLTAVVCGLLWPVLMVTDVTGRTRR